MSALLLASLLCVGSAFLLRLIFTIAGDDQHRRR